MNSNKATGWFGVLVLVGAAGCAAVEEDVLPLLDSQGLVGGPPNVMLVVDKSGSMNAPLEQGHAACPADCGSLTLCPAGCPTLWTELQSSVSTFVTESSGFARLGLITYPADAECLAPTEARIPLPSNDDPASLNQNGAQVRQTILGIQMALASSPEAGLPDYTGGGTPIGKTLEALERDARLFDIQRQNYILLLTDGLPNCNADHPVDFQSNPSACLCQAGTCAPPFNRSGCLDTDATVDVITRLHAAKVQTIVVGFGIDTTTSSEARDSLNRMAFAGGFPRPCPWGSDSECGKGDTCNATTKTCGNAFYLAKDSGELGQALLSVSASLKTLNP